MSKIFPHNRESAFFADLSSSLSSSLYARKYPQIFNNGSAYSKSVGKYAIAREVTKSKLSRICVCQRFSTLSLVSVTFLSPNIEIKSSTARSFFATESIPTNETSL